MAPYTTSGGPFIPYAPPSTPAQNPHITSHPRLSRCNSSGVRPISEYAENIMMMTASAPFTML
jgi:hypothetical protein